MDLLVETVAERCRWLHDVLRDEVRDLTQEQLDFVPANGANSIGTLIIHVVGSEAYLWGMVAGRIPPRDRAAEFASKGLPASELVKRLSRADEAVDELAPLVTYEALAKDWTRPTGPPTRTGAGWLIGAIGHGREHLAHIQLTKQVYPDRFSPPVRPA